MKANKAIVIKANCQLEKKSDAQRIKIKDAKMCFKSDCQKEIST